ncbi:MAG: hypothetical protein HC916_20710 [Coleofasciculaceae cyanobacterium SM2_1_6]|nr:hypothetical protein [Coleofasciculaceae cyanobacterium SM2_1_6]
MEKQAINLLKQLKSSKLSHKSRLPSSPKSILPLFSVLVLSLTGLVSCAPPSGNTLPTTPSPELSPKTEAPVISPAPKVQSSDPEISKDAKSPAPEADQAAKSPIAAPKPTVAINIYQVDNQCSDFVAESVNLPQDSSLEMAVARVIEKSNINELKLTSYQVTKDQSGVATIDFQVEASSVRKLVSLSSCEQLNLFGSLRKTLMENSNWQIKEVKFTEQGKEVVL